MLSTKRRDIRGELQLQLFSSTSSKSPLVTIATHKRLTAHSLHNIHGIMEGLTQFLILGLRTTLRHSRHQRDGVFLKISRFEFRNTKRGKKEKRLVSTVFLRN